MKCVMIFVSCVLAAASAGYTAHGTHLYSAPVVGPSSYAYQNSGSYPAASHAVAYNAPVAHGYAHGGYYGAEARLVDPLAIAAGAPLPVGDTYEVAAAKDAHFKAHAAAKSHAQASPLAQVYGYGSHYGAEARLVDPAAIAAGAPLPVGDTYEVAAAKAAHFKAHAVASGNAHGYSHATSVTHEYGYSQAVPVDHGYAHAGYYGSQARLVDPVAIAAGAPLPVGDTYEVAAAKAAHFKAHDVARGQIHASPMNHGYSHSFYAPVSHGYVHAAPVVYGIAHADHYGSVSRLVDPVAIAAGAPLPGGDTVEVATAKAAHLKALAAASSGHLGLH